MIYVLALELKQGQENTNMQVSGKTINFMAKGKEKPIKAPDILEVSKMENIMVMDTSFFLVDKSAKVNLKMI